MIEIAVPKLLFGPCGHFFHLRGFHCRPTLGVIQNQEAYPNQEAFQNTHERHSQHKIDTRHPKCPNVAFLFKAKQIFIFSENEPILFREFAT